MSWKTFNPCQPCCCSCDNKEVLVLIETSKVMTTTIMQNLISIFTEAETEYGAGDCRWAICDYRDYWNYDSDSAEYLNGWEIKQMFTADYSEFLATFSSLPTAISGPHIAWPQQQYRALLNIGSEWESEELGGGEIGYERVCIWIGASPGWNGFTDSNTNQVYPYLAEVLAGLDQLKVLAWNVRGMGQGIDGQAPNDYVVQQATFIVEAAQGQIIHNVEEYVDVRQSLCDILS